MFRGRKAGNVPEHYPVGDTWLMTRKFEEVFLVDAQDTHRIAPKSDTISLLFDNGKKLIWAPESWADFREQMVPVAA